MLNLTTQVLKSIIATCSFFPSSDRSMLNSLLMQYLVQRALKAVHINEGNPL